MRKVLPRSSRLKLDVEDYAALHRQVLARDNWRCQVCGNMRNLELHHIRFRSHSGSDSEDNLISLCATCHNVCHSG